MSEYKYINQSFIVYGTHNCCDNCCDRCYVNPELSPDDTSICILTYTHTSESGKSVSESYVSFNSGQPGKAMIDLLIKKQEIKNNVSANLTETLTPKYNETHETVMDISFVQRKSLLLWFNRHGKHMLEYYLLMNKYIEMNKGRFASGGKAYFADIIWRFPFDGIETRMFLTHVLCNLPTYKLVRYVPGEMELENINVIEHINKSPYNWIPDTSQTFIQIGDEMDRLYSRYCEYNPNKCPQYLFQFQDLLENQPRQKNRIKLPVSADMFVNLVLAHRLDICGETPEVAEMICEHKPCEEKIIEDKDVRFKLNDPRLNLIHNFNNWEN